MRQIQSSSRLLSSKLAIVIAFTATLAGCSSGGGDDSASNDNSGTVSPAQAVYDGSAATFDTIAAPSSADGLSSAEITAVQTEFDRIADVLLAS